MSKKSVPMQPYRVLSAYLELIAVVDPEEAASAPTSVRIASAAAEGSRFATWAVRADDLDALRGYLIKAAWALPEPTRGSRVRPDGVTLRWRTQFLAPPAEPGVHPFVIEWAVPPGLRPAEMAVNHPSQARGIRLARLGAPDPATASERLRFLMGAATAFRLNGRAWRGRRGGGRCSGRRAGRAVIDDAPFQKGFWCCLRTRTESGQRRYGLCGS